MNVKLTIQYSMNLQNCAMNERIKGLLGLAYKGKRIVIGEDVINLMKSSKLHLIIIASDSSEATLKRLTEKSKFYDKEYLIYGTKYSLGAAIGKFQVSSIGILDIKMKEKIKNLLKDGDDNGK